MTDHPSETYVLMGDGTSDVDPVAAARVLAPMLGHVRADLQQELVERPGLLAWGLAEPVAREAAAALKHVGIGVRVFANRDVVAPPSLVEVRRGEVLPEGFKFKSGGEFELARWDEIVYFDAVAVQLTEKVVEVSREMVSTDEGVSYANVPCQRLKASWDEFLDVICYQPWVHLRIHRDRFRYAEAGIPSHNSTAKRFLALVVQFKTRCDAAGEGPGVKLLFDGKSETRQRVPSMKMYDSLLIWRLTLRFRATCS